MPSKLAGIVEIDETFVGGKEANKHESKKLKAGRGTVGKTPVLGMRERAGRPVVMPIGGTDAQTIQAAILHALQKLVRDVRVSCRSGERRQPVEP
jgi:hypothetical protein